MASSQRVLSGSITKGSTAISIGPESEYANFDHYKQGHNVHTIDDLSSGLGTKIRSNTNLVRALSRRKLSENYYDDTKTPTILSGSSAEFSSPEVAGRFEYYVNHEQEKRDIGQTSYYEDGKPYKDRPNTDSGVELIQIKNLHEELPFSIVDNASLSSFDGKIDVMGIFKSTDGSTTEFPFNSKGIMAVVGPDHDFLRRGTEISEGVTTAGSDKFIPTSHYLDAPENFGDVLIPSIMNFSNVTLKPFKDVSDDVEYYLDTSSRFTSDGDVDIKEALMGTSFTVDDSRGTFDRMSVGGFDYESGDTDSILFGGLKR